MKKIKKAFTLAEVLITLGVIGVVASITLPTLIKEYNKHAWVNSLKENYSLLNQGFKKMIADDGVEFIEDTEVWRAINGDYDACRSSGGLYVPDYCKDFYAQLKKYFKIILIDRGVDDYIGSHGETEYMPYKYKYRNISDERRYTEYIIHLSNGAMIWDYYFYKNPPMEAFPRVIHALGGHMYKQAGYFNIDVNGNRGPNEFGKDIFRFFITERGQLAPYGGNDHAIVKASYNFTQEKLEKCKANGGSCGGYCDNTSRYDDSNNVPPGYSCAGLLIDQLNWKMDY